MSNEVEEKSFKMNSEIISNEGAQVKRSIPKQAYLTQPKSRKMSKREIKVNNMVNDDDEEEMQLINRIRQNDF